jgi:hypothetical protein
VTRDEQMDDHYTEDPALYTPNLRNMGPRIVNNRPRGFRLAIGGWNWKQSENDTRAMWKAAWHVWSTDRPS